MRRLLKRLRRVLDTAKALEDLYTRVEGLEGALEGIDVEWTEQYEKLNSLAMRLSKRDKRSAEAAPSAAVTEQPQLELTPATESYHELIQRGRAKFGRSA